MASFDGNPAAEAAIQYASRRYARRVADEVYQDMYRLCPVDTGELRDSIEVEATGDTVYVVVTANHWPYLEFGTSRMEAQPFIRPALNRRRGVVDVGGNL